MKTKFLSIQHGSTVLSINVLVVNKAKFIGADNSSGGKMYNKQINQYTYQVVLSHEEMQYKGLGRNFLNIKKGKKNNLNTTKDWGLIGLGNRIFR